MDKNFYVITPIFNPAGYKSRIRLYHQFANYIASKGGKLVTIELEYGEIPYEVTKSDNPNHIQLKTNCVIWHKENLINLAVQRLPQDWSYLAWIDADVKFVNENWVYDTVRALQFHPVVQMFSQAIDLSAENEILRTDTSLAYAWQHGLLDNENVFEKMYGEGAYYENLHQHDKDRYKFTYHPGFAWAIRRDTYDNLGGLMDFPVLGSADQHMAHAFVGRIAPTVHPQYNENYKKRLYDWQLRCDKYVKENLGYITGTILHYYHGNKKNRGYNTRFNILIKHQFDPDLDLEKDWQGLYRWTDRSPYLHYDILRYFSSRKEDETGGLLA